MKKIYFDYLGSWLNVVFVVLGIIFITVDLIAFHSGNSSRLSELSGVLGNAFIVLCLGKMFVFRNYAGWNKRGMNLRIGFRWGHNLVFNDLKAAQLHDSFLVITNCYREQVEVDLKGIRAEDRQRLYKILEKGIAQKAG